MFIMSTSQMFNKNGNKSDDPPEITEAEKMLDEIREANYEFMKTLTPEEKQIYYDNERKRLEAKGYSFIPTRTVKKTIK